MTLVHSLTVAAILLTATASAQAVSVRIDSLDTPDAWSYNPDGGVECTFARDTETVHEGAAAMRVTYAEAEPHWGNLRREVTVPPATTAVRFWLHIHEAAAGAAMHVWLNEADGDAWLAGVLVDGRTVGQLAPGAYDVTVPVSGFRFEARGPGTRDMPSASTMLLCFNFASMTVTVDDLRLELREGGQAALEPANPPAFERTERGAVAVLSDAFPITPGCSDPVRIAETLRRAGWGVTLLSGAQLAHPTALRDAAVDALVLPYGPAFPADAAEPIRTYLKSGGGLVSLGGYAFDAPMTPAGDGWAPVAAAITAAEMGADNAQSGRLNTRYGKAGDQVQFDPDQIQVFDPAFLLRRTVSIAAAEDQFIVPAGLEAGVAVDGYAAVSTSGSHSAVFPNVWARRIPLLHALDAHGQERGAVGSLVHNFAGPYAGSSWALFGATNADLFTASDALLADSLPAIVDAVARPTYIENLRTDWACYRPGEPVTVSGTVSQAAAGASVRLSVEGLGERLAEANDGVFAATFESAPAGDFHRVTAELVVDEETRDRCETAFVVWDPSVVASGPTPLIEGSRLTVNGHSPVLSGTNQTGFMWYSLHEDPLVWDRDFSRMRDHGVNVLRILHFSPFSEGGYEGSPTNRALALVNRPEKLVRQTDAIVQLAQRHGVIVFLTLHDWMPVGMTDEEYAAQADWNRFWTERYRDAPGVIYDIQNEPSIGDPPHTENLVALYNEQVRATYGDMQSLMDAWGLTEPPGEWGRIPPADGSGDWADLRSRDYWRFKMAVYNEWTGRNAEGIVAGDADSLHTVGHLPWNRNADMQRGSENLDFTCFHFYGPPGEFPSRVKFLDRRWEGKPFTVGEFGAQEAHQQRNNGGDGTRDAESIRRFLWYGHHMLGLGGSFLANWSWKDFEGSVFPWGIRYLQDDVSKDVLLAYRAQSLLFRALEPVYEEPRVYVLMPDSHRFGAAFDAVDEGVRRCFQALYHCGVPFGVLGEADLHRLPPSAEAILWPVPYCPSDDAFARVLAFVQDGGSLYLSGDAAFDKSRQPTRGDRLTALGLPGVAHLPPNQAAPAPDDLEAVVSRIGEGLAYFVPHPLELSAPERLVSTYSEFLATAGVEAPTPAVPPGVVHRAPLRGGGRVDVFANMAESGDPLTVASPDYEMDLGPLGCGLVAVDAEGEVIAVHAPGSVRDSNGQPLISGEADVMAFSLTGDPLASATAALVTPISEGEGILHVFAGRGPLDIELGAIIDGHWAPFERRRAEGGRDGLPLAFGQAEALHLVLISTPGSRDQAVSALESMVNLWR